MIETDQNAICDTVMMLQHTHELIVKNDRSEVGIVTRDIWETIDKIQKNENSMDLGNFKLYNCMFTDSRMAPFTGGTVDWVRIASIIK